MPEPAEIGALVEQGYLRVIDIAPILGVTKQRVSQVVAERNDFPQPAKVIGPHRFVSTLDRLPTIRQSFGTGLFGYESSDRPIVGKDGGK